MQETPDYVYQNWIKEAFDETAGKSQKTQIKILESIDDKLARMIELLEGQGRVRPS